jgi:hypothetical protein
VNAESDQRGATTERLSLGLLIPEQSPAPEDDFLTDPKRTEAWFEALPMADIGTSAREVFNALIDCNRMEIPDLARARVIEKFREPVDYLCRNLEKQYLGLGFPLSAKSRKTASLTRELNAELAIGYKIVIERMLRSEARRFDEKLMVVALHRATSHLGEVLYRSATVYEPWPIGVWRELHSIFAYASQNRIHRVVVKDAVGTSPSRGTSIADLYKRMLLFATANPAQLKQADMRGLYRECLDWANSADIASQDETTETLGRFHLDIWGDAPPVHNALSRPAINRRTKILDLRTLIHELKEQFDDATDDQPAGQETDKGLSRTLQRLLVGAWSQPSKRRFVRTHLNFELHLTAGLQAVHAALRGLTEPRPEPAQSKPMATYSAFAAASPRVPSWAATVPTSLSLAPQDGNLSDELTFDAPGQGQDSVGAERDGQVQWAKYDKAHSPVHSQVAKTTNESAGGYCVRWSADHPTKVNIGEIVGIGDGDGKEVAVSVIRWLKQDPSRDLEMGLEVVSQRSRPGEYWAGSGPNATRSDRTRQPGILLPETQPGAGDVSLITLSPDLKTGAAYWLSSCGVERRIRITRILETKGNFSRYDFELVNANEVPSSDRDEGFGELWKNT